MKKNQILMATAVLLAVAISVPLSFGAVTSTVFIGNNEVTLIPDPSGGITAGGSGGGTYTPEIVPAGVENGNPVYGVQVSENNSNVVPDGKKETFEITIPANRYFCIKIHEKHVVTPPVIKIHVQGYDYVTKDLTGGGGLNNPVTTYYSANNVDEANKFLMLPVSDINDITAMKFDDSVTISIDAERPKSTLVGNLYFPTLELSIIFMEDPTQTENTE